MDSPRPVAHKTMQQARLDFMGGRPHLAITRLTGLLNMSPSNSKVNKLLGHLLIIKGDLPRAGRYLYLESKEMQIEYKSVYLFEKTQGFDPINIAKIILPKNHFSITAIPFAKKIILCQLILRIEEKHGAIPNFLEGIQRHLIKIGIYELR